MAPAATGKIGPESGVPVNHEPAAATSPPALSVTIPPPTAPPLPGGATHADPPDVVSTLTLPDGDPANLSEEESGARAAAVPAPSDAMQFAISGYSSGDWHADAVTTATGRLPANKSSEALVQATGAQRKLYVSPSGADSNPGTAERPFRTLVRAARAVSPGTTVFVAPGRYAGGIRSAIHGMDGQRIAFVSTTKWGAQITPPPNSPNKTAWDNRADRVDIVGFDIDGASWQGGVVWTHGIYSGGSHDVIRHNRVRHIAQSVTCNGGGGAGIGVDSYYGGVNASVVANLVSDIGPPGCRFVQGIYVSTTAQVKNNVVFRVSGAAIHLWHDARNVIITNNTVTHSSTGIIVGGGNFYRSTAGNDFTAVYSNIVVGNQVGISEQGVTGRNNTYKNNLVYQNAREDWRLKNGVKHVGTVSAPPRFRAQARGGEPDWRLAPDSPAIGRGLADYAESTDFDGRPRNSQAGFDIGAYQH